MSNIYTIFISYPMNGKPMSELDDARKRLTLMATQYFNHMKQYSNALDNYDEVQIIDNFYAEAAEGDGRLHYLGQAIMKLDKANAIFFGPGCEKAKGCQIEYAVAKEYGLDIIDRWDCWTDFEENSK